VRPVSINAFERTTTGQIDKTRSPERPNVNRRSVIALFLSSLTLLARAQTPTTVYPGRVWQKAEPTQSGWSKLKLAEARRYFGGLADGSAVVVEQGRVVAEWGDPAKRVNDLVVVYQNHGVSRRCCCLPAGETSAPAQRLSRTNGWPADTTSRRATDVSTNQGLVRPWPRWLRGLICGAWGCFRLTALAFPDIVTARCPEDLCRSRTLSAVVVS
jgi:hypothetical protein